MSNKLIERERVVYSLNVEDIQSLAMQEIDRELTAEEIQKVEERLDHYIDWYQAIDSAISDTVKNI